jgi:hypothetical protein
VRRPYRLAILAVAVAAAVVIVARMPAGEQAGSPPQPVGAAPPFTVRQPPPAAASGVGAAAPSGAGAPGTPAVAFPAAAVHEAGGVTGSEELPPGAAPAAALVAERFARAWSTPGPRWTDRVAEYASPALAAALAGSEPVQPAPEVTGHAQVIIGAPRWVRMLVPTDRGDLVLDLTDTGQGWVVSAVDWQP